MDLFIAFFEMSNKKEFDVLKAVQLLQYITREEAMSCFDYKSLRKVTCSMCCAQLTIFPLLKLDQLFLSKFELKSEWV